MYAFCMAFIVICDRRFCELHRSIYTMPGYNTLPLQDNTIIQERLKCTHCQLIMRDPVQTKENGLFFCRECFNEVLKYVI